MDTAYEVQAASSGLAICQFVQYRISYSNAVILTMEKINDKEKPSFSYAFNPGYNR